jgi:hypothetical protein
MGKIFPLPSSLEPRTSNLEPQHQSAKSVKSFQSRTLLVAELSSSLAKCYKQRRKVNSGESALVLYSPQLNPTSSKTFPPSMVLRRAHWPDTQRNPANARCFGDF